MKKKIDLFWYWFILVVAFVLCFFVVNDKKINAYSLNSNGNIVSDNLFDVSIGFCGNISQNVSTSSYCSNFSYLNSNGSFEFSSNSWQGIIYIFDNLNVNTDYTLNFSIEDNANDSLWIGFYYLDNNNNSNYITSNFTNITFNTLNYTKVGFAFEIMSDIISTAKISNISFTLGSSSSFEPYGIWYSDTNAFNMYQGKLPIFTSSLIYDNEDTGETLTINDVNSYIDNSFGYLYFDRLWQYLDNLTSSSYSDARLTIRFNENLNINTSYIINSNKQNYGSGVWFYQNNDLMLDVRNFYNNEYCGGASQYSCNVDLNKYVNVGSGFNSFSYLNKIVVWSATTDERTLAFGYNNIGYNSGYDNGYTNGYKDGKNVADNLIYNNGYTNGYNVGYDKGVNYASNGGNTLVGLVGAIFTSPVNMLQTIFDFEFLGINLTNFLFSLISLFIVIWLIRKFL